MPTSDRETRLAAFAGTLASLAMIAYQMAGKATRDAIFLSYHPATTLPAMLIAAATLSLIIALTVGRFAQRVDPARAVPLGFALSAGLTLAEWGLIRTWPAPVSVAVYLHFTGLGALLVSGFWSVVNERFDPRSAKRFVSRIAAGGTAGGLVGGILAERVAAWLSVEAMFPILAACHIAAGILTMRVARGRTPVPPAAFDDAGPRPSGLTLMARWPYLRWLTVMVLCAGVAEGLVDLAFKSVAADAVGGGEPLLRFFATFYTAVGLASVFVQTALTRRVVQRYGVTGSAAILPGTMAVGAAGVLMFPGMGTLTALRGSELLFRNSIYRSAYELLFNPLAPREKRAVKPLIDVGVSRIGDSVAGALMQIMIWLSAGAAMAAAVTTPAMAVTLVFAVLAALSARQLHRGYQESLERSLLAHGRRLQDDPFDDPSQTAILQTMGAIDITQFARGPSAALDPPERASLGVEVPAGPAWDDPDITRIRELRSQDAARVRAALDEAPIPRRLIAFVVPLLAWDAVAQDAIRALRPIAAGSVGLLLDYLLDPGSDFSVRRRLPLALVDAPSPRTVEGLVRGLEDRRFEVRYRCGRVLARLHQRHPELAISREGVSAAIEREVAVDRGVWQSNRLLDNMEDDDWSPMLDEVVRDRASRSLEHVFTMLSLILPPQALRVAYRGLHTDDAMLRGTALEYLETALPDRIRQKLWPFLEASNRPRQPRHTDEVLRDLLQSQESIAHRLEVLKRLREEERPTEGSEP